MNATRKPTAVCLSRLARTHAQIPTTAVPSRSYSAPLLSYVYDRREASDKTPSATMAQDRGALLSRTAAGLLLVLVCAVVGMLVMESLPYHLNQKSASLPAASTIATASHLRRVSVSFDPSGLEPFPRGRENLRDRRHRGGPLAQLLYWNSAATSAAIFF